jgi:NitT/TauT family transport system substrate-binding protein
MSPMPSRRRFLTTMSLAGVATLVGAPQPPAAEEAPETTAIRLAKNAGICVAPQYVAEELLLRAEGFAELRYIDLVTSAAAVEAVGRGLVDFTGAFVAPLVVAIDSGAPITLLAGLHAGCFKLFGNRSIRTITDLKGKTAGVEALGSLRHLLLSLIAAQAGLDAVEDIRWVTGNSPRPDELFAAGKIDAFLGLPPEPQEMLARRIGKVVVNSTLDRPWSQYFCCMFAGNKEFVRKHPVATKGVLRAILKAADLCVSEPGRVAQRVIDGAYTDRNAFALETLSELRYRWREYDSADTARFYARRLQEAGVIKSSSQKIIGEGTDWRFLNELKGELKA